MRAVEEVRRREPDQVAVRVTQASENEGPRPVQELELGILFTSYSYHLSGLRQTLP
jgi:hypothetical protein